MAPARRLVAWTSFRCDGVAPFGIMTSQTSRPFASEFLEVTCGGLVEGFLGDFFWRVLGGVLHTNHLSFEIDSRL